jgi:hypothetical protein
MARGLLAAAPADIDAETLSGRLGPAATFATTEHFNLQTARSITVSESNGRARIYLAALSSNRIALEYIGETSRLTSRRSKPARATSGLAWQHR